MDSRNFLAFSLSLILIFPPISSASIRFISRWSSSNREGTVIKQKTSASSLVIDPTRVTQLSWTPRVFLYKGLLTDEECDHFINLAKGKLEKSMVADNDSGKSVESEVRTSSGMFLSKRQDDIVANVETKLAAWTFLPEENGESMQILHYENGQKYEPHFDFFHDQVNQQLGGHRIATVLMYLSNVKKGGETVFPMWKGATAQPKDDSWTQCAKQGYAVKPMKGDALLFFNLHPNATTDPSSLHGSCPVVEGEKWSATRWIHVKSFERPVSRTTGCVDENESCEKWAKAGECKKNPVYMVLTEFRNISGHGNSSEPFFVRNFKTEPSNNSILTQSNSAWEMMRNATSHESYHNSPMIFTHPTSSEFHFSNHSNFPLNGATSSCSSSSSSASITQPNQGAQAFCWSDYLLSDPVLPLSSQTQVVGSSAASNLNFNQNENFNSQGECSSQKIASKASGTRHSASSFVDEILDKDQEMLSQFPQLLNDFDY
ncbi:unnamed protein product [Brassica oleracea]